MNKDAFIEEYKNGKDITYIAKTFDISEDEVLNLLKSYVEEQRTTKGLKDEIKMVIATRDSNGVARAKISKELNININTIRKSCEKFGKASKHSDIDTSIYEVIEGEFTVEFCPKCNSKRNNLLEENHTYCLDCGSEHEYKEGQVLRVKFENIN